MMQLSASKDGLEKLTPDRLVSCPSTVSMGFQLDPYGFQMDPVLKYWSYTGSMWTYWAGQIKFIELLASIHRRSRVFAMPLLHIIFKN